MKLSFEEYLTYDDGTDVLYELVDGELVPMTPVSPKHSDIAEFLDRQFYRETQRLERNWKVKRGDVAIQTQTDRSRLPDVVAIDGEVWQNLRESLRALLTVPPLLVVEVIHPDRRTEDILDKRDEYQALRIPEYWTVDWDTNTPNITVRSLVDGRYQTAVFTASQRIFSRTFPELVLTAEQVLSA
jgi:Uma2 family endonuclease